MLRAWSDGVGDCGAFVWGWRRGLEIQGLRCLTEVWCGDGCAADPMQGMIMDEDLAKNQYPAAKIGKEKEALAAGKVVSHMMEYITPELFETYKDMKSGGLGEWTIARAINTGVQHPRSIMCVLFCGDGDCVAGR